LDDNMQFKNNKQTNEFKIQIKTTCKVLLSYNLFFTNWHEPIVTISMSN